MPTTQGIPVYPIWDDGFAGCWTWGQDKANDNANLLTARKVNNSWKIYRKSYATQDGDIVKKQVKSIWTDKQFHTEKGQAVINGLFNTKEKVFQSPKSVALITELTKMSQASDSDIILDFFSGSATTAHAVMQLNAEDGGNRRFIMVQLPEVCDEKSEAYKAGYKNICEIGKERIRRAGNKILTKVQAENAQLSPDQEEKPLPDVGFRVFKLDTSNLKIWDNTPIPGGDVGELERRLRGMLEIVKDDRDNLDVVYEVMLKLGQDLCEDILELDISGKTVYGVGAECDFIVCLAPHITAEDAEEMAEYAPGRIIFTDGCFHTSSDKRNVQLTLKDRGINMKML